MSRIDYVVHCTTPTYINMTSAADDTMELNALARETSMALMKELREGDTLPKVFVRKMTEFLADLAKQFPKQRQFVAVKNLFETTLGKNAKDAHIRAVMDDFLSELEPHEADFGDADKMMEHISEVKILAAIGLKTALVNAKFTKATKRVLVANLRLIYTIASTAASLDAESEPMMIASTLQLQQTLGKNPKIMEKLLVMGEEFAKLLAEENAASDAQTA